MAVLREAIGIDEPGQHPWAGAAVMLDAAIGTKSTQRICLQDQAEGLTLRSWPGELQRQAKALYRTGRAQRLLDFVAEHPGEWLVRPNVHLAFWNAPPRQRLYLDCRLSVTEYAARWSGDDFDQVRRHRYSDIRETLWPWLRKHQYAGSRDDLDLDAFLRRLGRRDAHLRPGMDVRRVWSWPQAVDLDQRGALVGAVRAAVAELLMALDEPLPPACAGSA